jgi:16S rRNA (guanine966-N2)-methyltransferase
MRVIAGRFGRRKLEAPAGNATRPTADRVREALFSMLGDISRARVLDLYAGSGALGIEALSRGAEHATFVEARASAITTLRKNLSALDLRSEATVLPLRVERAERSVREHGPYDLVFADPPWDDLPEAAERVFRLLAHGVLAPEARVLVEHPARARAALTPGSGFAEVECRAWGDTQVSLFVHEIAEKPRV